MVGGAAAASYRFTVPGGAQVRAAGVTAVGVQPTHRRRGINTSLMRAQLDDVRARGEPIAVLYASEGGIYGRFGYGLASFLGEIDVEAGRTTFIRGYRPAGRVRLLTRTEALPLMRPVYDRAQERRPGMIAMDDRWWEWLFFEEEKEKDEPTFFAVHDIDGAADAFATYRVKHEWTDSLPNLELSVRQLVATTPQAYADIWRYLFDIDLVRRVKAWNRPVDEPLFFLMQEPRRLRFRTTDALRVRLVELPSALEARGFVGDGRIVVEVEDVFCPWNEGRYALDVSAGTATCGRTDDEPDIACSAADLGTTYLGGATFRQLHRAGRVTELHPGGLDRADALFASDPVPWSSFIF
jgi:predicted acetyltransferase